MGRGGRSRTDPYEFRLGWGPKGRQFKSGRPDLASKPSPGGSSRLHAKAAARGRKGNPGFVYARRR